MAAITTAAPLPAVAASAPPADRAAESGDVASGNVIPRPQTTVRPDKACLDRLQTLKEAGQKSGTCWSLGEPTTGPQPATSLFEGMPGDVASSVDGRSASSSTQAGPVLPDYCPTPVTGAPFITTVGTRWGACSVMNGVVTYIDIDSMAVESEYWFRVAAITSLHDDFNGRDWEVDLHITPVSVWGILATGLELNPEITCTTSNTADCAMIQRIPLNPWAPVVAGTTQSTNYHFASSSGVTITVGMKLKLWTRHPATFENNPFTHELAPNNRIRCDNGAGNGANAGIGCVFPSFVPTLELSRSRRPVAIPAIDHTNDAQQTLAHHWGLRGAGPPLHRIMSDAQRLANHDAACVPGPAPRPGDPPDWTSCDEYPFASTREGAAMDGAGDYSARLIPVEANNSQGGLISDFYAQYRVREGDAFWVRVVPSGSLGGQPKIMVVGDSISQGHEGDYTWRYRLANHLKNNGVTADFVGSWIGTNAVPDRLPSGWPDVPSPPVYNGSYHSGVNFDYDHYSRWGRQLHEAKDNIAGAVAAHMPDYLLVELAFNDIAWGVSSPDGTLNDLRTFVAQARLGNPDIRILVGNMLQRTPLSNNTGLPARTSEYNSKLGPVLQSLSTAQSPVVLVDLDGPYNENTDAYDGLHPNSLGEYKLARSFANVLSSRFGIGPQFGSIPSTAEPVSLARPQSVTATPTDSGIFVAWTHSFGASGYWLYQRDVTEGGTFTRSWLPIPADSWHAGWLISGHTYEFKVVAAHGSVETAFSPTAAATARLETAGGPPTDSYSVIPASTSIAMSWTRPTGSFSSTISGYRVYWSDQNAAEPSLSGKSVTGTSTTLSGLIPGHKYGLAVASVNAAGEGTPSGAPAAIVGAGTPGAPASLTAQSTSSTSVRLTWPAVTNAAGYWIWTRDKSTTQPASQMPYQLSGTTWDILWLVAGTTNYEVCVQAANGTLRSGRTCRTPSSPPVRQYIVDIANGQVGNGEVPPGSDCTSYGPCVDWCALFATWVWERAGLGASVDGVPRDIMAARGLGQWGVEHLRFKARPSGSIGSPEPGDWVIYGPPAYATGGHVDIVVSVNAGGTLTVVGGNVSNTVTRRTINPLTQTGGSGNYPVSGYVSPSTI